MTTSKLNPQQEQWLLDKIAPAPEVFVVVYAGTCHREWKLLAMCSREKFDAEKDWMDRAKREYPSALIVKAFIAQPEVKGANE